MLQSVCFSLLAFSYAPASTQDSWPLTRAEKTMYSETSHYADVIQFAHDLQRAGAPIRVEFIGESAEAKPIPMIVASRPLVASPIEARRSGKPVVYIQANIHAGEVEGKEAAQILLRKYVQEKTGILDKLILIVNPIYNADGNDKFGPAARNRPGQNGPELVGVRANGQGLDLNRDCIKAVSFEMRAALDHVYTKWDPDVVMDLHTTNGVRHGYDFTYSPPTNPNTESGVLAYTRDELLPAVRAEMRSKRGWEFFDYVGGLVYQGKQAWCTFGSEGRYVSNYAGLRNRIGILSEAVSYLPFKERIETTIAFVDSLLVKLASDASRVVSLTKAADEKMKAWARSGGAAELGVRFDLESRGEEEVLLEKRPSEGAPRNTGRPTEIEKVKMPVMDRFKAIRNSRFPLLYVVPAKETDTIKLLMRHGIVVDRALDEAEMDVDQFMIREFVQGSAPFQGHKLIRLEGAFHSARRRISRGDFFVFCDQPTGGLAFHILEPESEDGAAAWGFLGETLEPGTEFPIAKSYARPKVATERVTTLTPKTR